MSLASRFMGASDLRSVTQLGLMQLPSGAAAPAMPGCPVPTGRVQGTGCCPGVAPVLVRSGGDPAVRLPSTPPAELAFLAEVPLTKRCSFPESPHLITILITICDWILKP